MTVQVMTYVASRKVNDNFEELDLRNPVILTASNVGDVGEGIFAQKDGTDLHPKISPWYWNDTTSNE